ncbi:uncharacterized protein LOC130894005 isoform X2 [Diorhabda carinulata]|uniref:uncharacterized protein LOC130894005 isoform X2 n=1 Tax=Diorhabda carinulata TaxID=1163345 RepID=UPI0025A247FC|nr:uncharacterized protein LOC130894005 isoform X2 [Diorhabda carinulata]
MYFYQCLKNTTIHRYPNFASGFSISMTLMIKLSDQWKNGKVGNSNFHIDSSHELSKFVWSDGDGPMIIHEKALCSSPLEENSSYQCLSIPNAVPTCDNLVPRQNIYFAVKTCKKFHRDRVPIVKNTWGKYATVIKFFSDTEDKSIPTVNLRIPNTETGHCAKTMAIIRYIIEDIENNNDIEWIIIVDDDTILGVANLQHILACYDPSEKIGLGERYGYQLHFGGYTYITGGGGMVFSKPLLEKLARNCKCSTLNEPDDMILGLCMARMGIEVTHSPAFHQARPPDYNPKFLESYEVVSFHKHYMLDPVEVYIRWFEAKDRMILQTMSQWMNFQVKIYEPENIETELWGRNLITGTYTGIIGEIVNTEADIALGELYYTPYLLDLMDLTIPYNTECLTFITPEALTDNSWKTLILPFKPILWTGVLVSLVVTILCFYYLSNFYATTTSIERNSEDTLYNINSSLKHRKVITVSINPNPEKINENEKYTLMREKYQQSKQEEPNGLYQFSEPINSALYTYSMLLLVSLPKLPTGWSLRLLTGWYWLYCLLVVTAYRASMTAILARPSIAVKIDTIEQLIKSRLTYAGWGEINEHFFKTSADPSLEIISDNFVLVNDSEEAVDKVAEGSFAFYENTYFLKEALVKRQQRFQKQFSTNENSTNQSENLVNVKNDRILHIMEDCIIKMPISIGLQKNSPLKPRIDKFIRQVSEAGFIEKWLDDVMQKVYTTEIQIEDSGTTKAIMNLRKFSGALVALVFGYLVALIVLMAENIYFYLIVSKHPHFNKYTKQIVTKSN